MPTPFAQRLSRTLYTTDGVTTNWDFAFSDGYLDQAHVKARVDTPAGVRTEITVTPGMLVGPFQLQITPALGAGDVLTIYRDTPKDAPLVNFSDESGFSEIALDTNARQAVMVAAETADEVNTSDIGVASESAIAATTAAAAALSSQTAAASSAVVANSAKVAAEAALDSFDDRYLGAKANDPALDNDSNALLTGALYWNTVASELRVYTGAGWLDTGSALANAPVEYTFNGTGAQTLFTLATTPASSKFVAVTVGGVLQESSAYTLVGTALTFSEAPPVGTGNVGVTVFTPAPLADAATVAYSPSGAGAVSTTVQAKLRETASVLDFGADPTGVDDSFTAFDTSPDNSLVPPGTYELSASVIDKTFFSFGDVTITGDGSANIVNLIDEFNNGFVAVDAGEYPGTSDEYKSEPSLVATTSGKVLCFYRIGPGHQGDVGDTGYLVYRIYNKLTGAWGATQTLANRTGWDSRNQVAGVTPTGRIIVAYAQVEYTGPGVVNPATRVTNYRYSDDDGLSWSAELNLSQYCSYPSLDNVPFGHIVSFANGDLLISLYNYHTIITLRSTDDGTTWGTTSGSLPNPNPNLVTVYTTPVTSDDNITEPTIVKLDDNRLVAVCRDIPTGLVDDGTVTWLFLGVRWAASTYYEVGQYVNTTGLRVYRCTTAGTSSSTEPTSTVTPVSNGSVVWEYIGTSTNRAATTAYGLGDRVVTYSNYLYQCAVAGTTGSTAPFYAKLGGNETQMAYFKSDNGGASWGAAQYVTWTADTYQVSNSPPRAICTGDTVDVAWFSRSDEWTLYRVRMQARAFFENPSWAFALPGSYPASGEPRNRVMRSFLASASSNYAWRIDCGYVDLTYLPWTNQIMTSWYDKSPAQLGQVGKTTLYSTIIKP